MGKEKKYEQAKKRAREAFILFEHKEGSKLVDFREIPTVLRSLGINPRTDQIQMIVDQITASMGEDISYVTVEQFETVTSKFLVDQEPQLFREDYFTLLRAFRAFDPDGKGFVEAEQLRNLMATKGDVFTVDELNNMISFSADETGKVWYEDYAWKLANDGKRI